MTYPLNADLQSLQELAKFTCVEEMQQENRQNRPFICESDERAAAELYTFSSSDGSQISAYVISPAHADVDLPAMVFFHGGGFMLKASPRHFRRVMEYAAQVPCRVVFPDYRVAPEFPFPAAAEDACAAYRWTLEHAASLHIDASRIILAGDSAGGNLAAAAVLMARDRGLPTPRGVMLVYPVTDRRMQTPSMAQFMDTPIWDAPLSRMMWETYLSGQAPEAAEYASPAEASTLEGFPPTYLEAAEFDPLRDEGLRFGEQLRRAGTPVESHVIYGACHGYESLPQAPLVQACFAQRLRWLQTLFSL